MTTRSDNAIVNIIKQGPRLTREAIEATPGANEAYLIVHGAMARAMERVAASARREVWQAVRGQVLERKLT